MYPNILVKMTSTKLHEGLSVGSRSDRRDDSKCTSRFSQPFCGRAYKRQTCLCMYGVTRNREPSNFRGKKRQYVSERSSY